MLTPQITPASKSFGDLNKPQNIPYSVSDSDGDTFGVAVDVDGTQKESYKNQTGQSYTISDEQILGRYVTRKSYDQK